MNDSDAQKSISNLFGIIQGIIPYDKKLTNEEKLELIYTRELILQEKLEAIIEVIKVHDAEDQYELADTREKLERNMMKKTNIIEEIKKILS